MKAGDSETSLLQSISSGAAVFTFGRLLQKGLGFAFHLGLTLWLGSSLYGFYAYANTIIRLAGIFADVGTSKTALRYLPTYDDASKRNVFIGLGTVTSFFGSLIIALGLFILAPIFNEHTFDTPLFQNVLRIFAIVIPFNSLSKFISNSFRSINKVFHHTFIRHVLEPTLRLLFVTLALVLGYSIVGAIWATVLAAMVVLTISAILTIYHTSLRPSLRWSSDDIMNFYSFSVPLAFKDISTFLYNRVDILMIGFLLPQATSVGIYNIGMLLSSLLALPLSGFNQLFPPIAAQLLDGKKKEKLERIHSTLARWTVSVTVLLTACIGIYAAEILRVFGEDFVGGKTVVLILLLGQLMNSIAFGTGYILLVTDRKYLILANQWTFGILNVVLNYFFINEFGIAGAALATASVYVGLNLTRIIEVWYLERIFPYSVNYFKPLISGFVAGVIMFALSYYSSGIIMAVVGSLIGTTVFGATLYVLGIEEKDREFIKNHIMPDK